MGDFDALLAAENQPRGDEILGSDALGDLIGVSGRVVRDLAARGILKKVDGSRYAVRDAVRAYCGHLREQAAGRSGSATLTEERIRVAREQADALAMKNAVTRGEMVPARDVEAAWADTFRGVRSAMLALPSRVHQHLSHLTQHDVAEIDRVVRDLLEDTANGS